MLLEDKRGHVDKVKRVISECARDGGEDEIMIYSGGEKKMISRRALTLFSPVIRSLVSSLQCCTAPSIILPDFSPSTISHLLNIITAGFTRGVKTDSFREIYEIINLAKHIGIDISDLRHDAINVEMFDRRLDEPTMNKTLQNKDVKEEDNEKKVVEDTSKTMRNEKILLLQEKQKKISKDILSFISRFRRGEKELECPECLLLLTRNSVVDHLKHHMIELDQEITQLENTDDEEITDNMVKIEVDIGTQDNVEESVTN